MPKLQRAPIRFTPHFDKPQRGKNELLRLLAAPDPVPVLDDMLARNVLAPVLPEARDRGRLAALLHAGPPELHEDPVLRLAALLATDRAGAEGAARRLRLSRDQRDRLADLADLPAGLAVGIAPRALRRLLYGLGAARVRDLVLLHPYQSSYFNPLVGKIGGAAGNYEMAKDERNYE